VRSHAFLLLLTLIILGVAQVFAGTESSNWTHYQDFGPLNESGQYAATDGEGKLWITDYGTPGLDQVVVFAAGDTNQVSFSPITQGMLADSTMGVLDQCGGVAYHDGIVYVISYATNRYVFRYDAATGDALPGWPLAFAPGDIDIDDNGNVFIGYKVAAQFAVFDLDGNELSGSPLGAAGWHINRGIGVSPDGKKVYLADESSDIVALWEGGVANGVASFTQSAPYMEGLLNPSACEVDKWGTVYVSDTGNNRVLVTRDGVVLQELTDVVSPRGAAATNDNLYLVNFTGTRAMVSQYSYGPTAIEEYFDGGVTQLTWNSHPIEMVDGVLVEDSTAGTIASYVGHLADSDGGFGYATTGELLADQTVSMDIYLEPVFDGAKYYQGMAVRADTSSEPYAGATTGMYYRYVFREVGSEIRLQRRTDAWTTIKYFYAGTDYEALSPGWHNLKLTVVGNRLWPFLDGKLLPGAPYVDDAAGALAAGFPGVLQYGGTATTGMRFDNFIVSDPNIPPVVDVVPLVYGLVNQEVQLSGMASDEDGGATTVLWTQTAGPEVTLSDATSENPTFTPTVAGTYEFEVVPNDGVDGGLAQSVSVLISDNDILAIMHGALTGAHRGAGIDPHTGRHYVANTSNYKIYVFDRDNLTTTPDDSIEFGAWQAWLGPYGLDVADDGMIYMAVWVGGDAAGVYQVSPYGDVNQVVVGTGALRGLTVRGGGASTEIFYLLNGGEMYKATTTDGVNFTAAQLAATGQNASLALVGNTVYTANYYSGNILAWDATTGASIPFTHDASLASNAIAVRPAADDTTLFVGYRETIYTKADTLDVEKIGKISLNTGNILTSTIVGDSTLNPYGSVFTFDVVDGKEIFWAASNGIIGTALDVTADPGNRTPGARATRDLALVTAGTAVTLDGSASGDIDGDALSYTWTQVSGPALDPANANAAVTTATPVVAGDYVFELVVNDGQASSDAVSVSFTAEDRDLLLTFDSPADTTEIQENWDGDLEDNGSSTGFTTAALDTAGGIEGGAIRLADGGYTMGYERTFSATANAYFKLSAYVKVQTSTGGAPSSLVLQVTGITPAPVSVDLSGITDYTKVEIEGVALGTVGKLQVTGSMPFAAGVLNYVWLDSIAYDDDAVLASTNTLSGVVNLSDNPTDLSNSWVRLVGYESMFSDSSDASGNYSIAGIPTGTYDVLATRFGYKDVSHPGYVIAGDSTLDFTLSANQSPVADAGADLTGLTAGSFYRLDGTGTFDPDGDELTYTWASLEGLLLQDAATDTPGFRPAETGTYTFTLSVNDGTEESNVDTVRAEVTVAGADPYGFAYVDKFGGVYGYHGVTVDPEGKVWGAGFYGGNYLRCYYPDGTEADFSPITTGLVGGNAYSTETSCRGVTTDQSGNIIYATSSGNHIMRFDYRTGDPIDGMDYSTSMAKPTVDMYGNIYVSNVVFGEADVITIYDSTWTPMGSIPMGINDISRAIEVNWAGDTLMVARLNANGGVSMYTKSAGVWGYAGQLEGPFNGNVSAVDYDALGRLWVSDENADTYFVYSQDLSRRDALMHEFTSPRGAATDASGKVAYLADFNGQFIERWSAGGQIFLPIAAVRENDADGVPVLMDSIVTVHGYVTVGNEYAAPNYIQSSPDGGPGLAIFDYNYVDSLNIGDEVILTGQVTFYNGLTELKSISYLEVMSTENELMADSISVAAFADTVGEMYEGMLVRIDDCTMDAVTFAGNTNYVVNTPDGSFTMRIDKDTDIVGYDAPTGTFSVVGVFSQFDSSSPYWSGYQLLPRNIGDLGLVSGIGDGELGVPTVFALHQNYPNPFNPTTTIKYDLPKNVTVKIEIFNILGQKVRTLVNATQEAGYKSVEWNGLNDNGMRVASGQYIYRIEAGEFIKSKKMITLK
jgi:hypothetical protein